jgi:hypothetical protein
MDTLTVSTGHKIATRALGIVFAGLAATMTFKAGYPLGGDDPAACWLLGIGLGAVTIAVALLLHHIDQAFQAGKYGWMVGLSLFWGICVVTEYGSHVMFTVGHRAANETGAQIQDAVYTDARQAVKDNEALIATFKENLGKLQATNSWLPTVTADALRAKLESAQKAIDLEAAKHGCKDKCLARMQEKADLASKIAIAEQKEDLSKRIAATQELLDKYRAQSATLKPGTSAVTNTSEIIASLVSLQLHPGEDAKGWASKGIGAVISLVFSLAGGILLAVSAKTWMAFNAPSGGVGPATGQWWQFEIPGGPLGPQGAPKGPGPGSRAQGHYWETNETNSGLASPVVMRTPAAPQGPQPIVSPVPAAASAPVAGKTRTVIEKHHFDNNGLTRDAIADALARQGLMAKAA